MFRRQEIGVDLGTTSVRIFVKGQGIVLREPAVVALAPDTNEIRAVGHEAVAMSENAPTDTVLVQPMRGGMVTDYTLTETLLKMLISRVGPKYGRMSQPDIALCTPSSLTEAETRAALRVSRELARHLFLVEKPLAAALGAGIDVQDSTGSMLVRVGGGRTEIAILSHKEVIAAESLPVAGGEFDEAIVRMARRKHNLLLGGRTAENVKLELGTAIVSSAEVAQTKVVRGRDLNTGTPKTVSIRAEEVEEALRDPLRKLAQSIRRVLEAASPEHTAEVISKGIVLCGGGALLRHLEAALAQQLGLSVTLADDPADCAVFGLGRVLEHPSLRDAFLHTS